MDGNKRQIIAMEAMVMPCLASTWRNLEMYASRLKAPLCSRPAGIGFEASFIDNNTI
tara:strand:+ start:99 stop:269 length:171 start_codon:yes stop_codon:yes gene_type:complete